jgi:hypothetical protein
MRDRLTIEFSELETTGIEYHFHLSGENQSRQTSLEGGRYGVYGKGIEIESLSKLAKLVRFDF